jgi:hypothetical protein
MGHFDRGARALRLTRFAPLSKCVNNQVGQGRGGCRIDGQVRRDRNTAIWRMIVGTVFRGPAAVRSSNVC